MQKRGLRKFFSDKKGLASSETTEKAKSLGGKSIMVIFLILILFVGLPLAVIYFQSDAGQAFLESTGVGAGEQLARFADVFRESTTTFEQIGAQDYFGRNKNTESRKKGVDLADLKFIGNKDLVPAGYDFVLNYEIEFNNVDDEIIEDTTFYCKLIKEEEGVEIEGKIIPKSTLDLYPSRLNKVSCLFQGPDTTALDGAYTIYGWLDFDYQTEDVTLPIYIIDGRLADQLNQRDQDFFNYYKLGISSRDLKVTYNGEPLGITLGVTGEYDTQPLVVRTESSSFNTLGIRLTNDWSGDLVSLDDVKLNLPNDIKIDESVGEIPSLGCPFEFVGEYREVNEYVLSDNYKNYLFEKDADGNIDFVEPLTFECWLAVDENIFLDSPYTKKEISAEMQYTYRTSRIFETISIKGEGESLIQEREGETLSVWKEYY